MADVKHYNQKPIRNAEFLTPPNLIKAKVGNGGLSNQLLMKTQKLLEEHAQDFTPLAKIYLDRMAEGIEQAKSNTEEFSESEDQISLILFPCVQLKANGTMFQYPLVTRLADRFVQFMEVVERLDKETLEIAEAFYSTIKIVVSSQIKGTGGSQGEQLVEELNAACMRYFAKHKERIEEKKKKQEI